MLTVFPTLVRRPTLLKMATRALKAPWSKAGLGKTYTERQRERVAYEGCGTVIAVGSMSSHLMT